MIWLQIRETSPDTTPEQIRDMILSEVEDELARLEASGESGSEAESQAMDNVVGRIREVTGRPSGEDELGNSTGPPQTETEAGEAIDQSPGDGSAAS